MKVRNINTNEFGVQAPRPHEAPDGIENSSVSFRRTLTTLTDDQQKAHMEELMGKIDEQGERLTKRADIKEFEKYRQLIREFLDEVVSNGYAFTKDNAFGSRGRHRFFATVKTIDQKLDEMARDLLTGQADNISLLHQIDDIRGLILDVML